MANCTKYKVQYKSASYTYLSNNNIMAKNLHDCKYLSFYKKYKLEYVVKTWPNYLISNPKYEVQYIFKVFLVKIINFPNQNMIYTIYLKSAK